MTVIARKPPVIDFSQNADRIFTQVFYKVRQAQLSGKRFFVNYGGGGSSKSVSQHQSELINLLKKDWHCDILIMRKVAADIYDSSYKLLESQANRWGIYNKFEWAYSQNKRQIVNKKTGKRIFFRGADDIDKLKSIVGVGRIILEEADAFTFEDFKEINRRARGFQNIQIVFLLNPVDEEHWIKTKFVDEEGPYHDRTVINHSTYRDNQFLTEEDKLELELLKLVDENEYNIYALGKWGRLKTGAEFYPQFKESVHVGKFAFDRFLPAHLTYDFNSVPYMTLLPFQYIEEPDLIRIRFFGEYCLPSPRNTAEIVSQEFVEDYEKWLHTLFYYGDASGNSKIAGKGDEVNYDDVRKVLYKYIDDSSDRTASYNKPIMQRRKLVMKCLAGQLYYGTKKVVLEFDESCVKTIQDFKYLKIGPNGKLKEEVTEKKTGQKYQKFGHCTDAVEYAFCELFDELM